MSDPALIRLGFSTDDLNSRDRVEGWRELFGRTICELDIEPLSGHDFRSRAVIRALPGLGVASGTSSGARYWRSRQLIRSDDLVFVINHDGTDRASMMGRETVVAPGQAVLFSAGNTGGTTNRGFSRFTTIRIPRSAIAPALRDVEAAILQPVAADNPALQLLGNYISVLNDANDLSTADASRLVVSHVHDLIALALGATRDGAELAGRRGLAAARRRAIKLDIAQRAADIDLGITSIARAHGLSPRYIQVLFEEEGTTFSEYLGLQRLALAHRLLVDGGNSQRKISDIALAAGFGNVSYFNRAFRRMFGATPSDIRSRNA